MARAVLASAMASMGCERVCVRERAIEELDGEGIEELALDQALERAGAIEDVVAFVGKGFARGFCDVEGEAAIL